MRKLTCPCEQEFNVDLPDVINLDASPDAVSSIADGSFLSCVCPGCNTVLHTDLETKLDWPSHGTSVLLIPEIDRYAFMSGKRPVEDGVQLVIGYAELADRIAVLAAGLEPIAIEAVKFRLAEKAREGNPGVNLTVLFEQVRDDGNLEFHIHGLKTGEVAITVVPRHLYENLLDDARAHPDEDLYAALVNGAYISVQNVMVEDGQND
jgi:hypothetical protein